MKCFDKHTIFKSTKFNKYCYLGNNWEFSLSSLNFKKVNTVLKIKVVQISNMKHIISIVQTSLTDLPNIFTSSFSKYIVDILCVHSKPLWLSVNVRTLMYCNGILYIVVGKCSDLCTCRTDVQPDNWVFL